MIADRIVVQEEYLHLRSVRAGSAVSGRHHLGNVARDGLEGIHGYSEAKGVVTE
jgi:hypothetical protein